MNLSPFKRLLRGAMLCLCLAVLASAATPLAASASSGRNQPKSQATPAKKAWVRDASSSGEIQLKLEAKLNGPGVFVFEGDTIAYLHESDAEYPREVTVDDMPWDDLTKPFKIDYEMDVPKAVITSSNGPRTFKVRKSDGQFRIEIDDSVYTWPNYVIVVATKKQVERKNTSLSDLRIQRPPSDYGAPAMMWFPGMEAPKSGRPAFDEASGAAPRKESPYQNDPDAPRFNPSYTGWGATTTTSKSEKIWEDGIKNRSITLTGQFFGNGTFIFEGRTITYRHETREYPSMVQVNDAIWGMPTKPFLLPFEIETAEFTVKQTKGDRRLKVTKVSDDRFEIFIKDPEGPPGSSLCQYAVTITPGKPIEPKGIKSSSSKPLPEHKAIHVFTSNTPRQKSAAPTTTGSVKTTTSTSTSLGSTATQKPWNAIGTPPGKSDEELYQDQVWNDCRKLREIILAGQFRGSGTFVFEGDTISYRHESGEYPIVTVNGKYWGARNFGSGIPSEPFQLPFRIETAQFVLQQTEGNEPVKVAKISDRKFEVSIQAPETTSNGERVRYAVTIDPMFRTFESDPPRQTSTTTRQTSARTTTTTRSVTPLTATSRTSSATTSQSQAKPAAKAEQKTGPANFQGGSIPVEPDINDGRLTTPGDFSYNGYSDVVFAQIEEDGTELEYGMDGDDLEKQGTLDPSVRLVCARDMDMDHRVDLVACRTVEAESGTSIEVGYGKSGKMDDWHVIGDLGVPEGVVWDVYCGNLTGRWNRNSILWHSPTLGAMGYWPDGQGVNSWVSIPGEFKAPEWTLLGLGDFTESLRSLRGAKKPRASVLFLRDGSIVGYVTPDDGKFTELGRLDEGWEIAAIGDFTKSGCDDLVVFHSELRQVGLWENGRQSKWRSLGAFGAGTVIEGAGDYDSDNELDLLARQGDGAMGYYPKADLTRFVPFGYKKDSSWTVIP